MMLNGAMMLNGPNMSLPEPTKTPVNPKKETVYLTGDRVRVRSQPNSKPETVVGHYDKGDKIEVFEKALDKGGFATIASGKHANNFISRSYLSPTAPKKNVVIGPPKKGGKSTPPVQKAGMSPAMMALLAFVVVAFVMSQKGGGSGPSYA